MVFFPMVSHEPRSDERKSGVPKSADCHQPLLFEEARIGGGGDVAKQFAEFDL